MPRPRRQGRQLNNQANRPLRRNQNQAGVCTCPDCDYQTPHQRGVACSTQNCPDCGTPLRGANCS